MNMSIIVKICLVIWCRFFLKSLLTFCQLAFSGEPSRPSLYKNKQNFQLNNCAIAKIPKKSHWSKLLLNAVFCVTNLIQHKIGFRKQISATTFGNNFAFQKFIEFSYSDFGKIWFSTRTLDKIRFFTLFSAQNCH